MSVKFPYQAIRCPYSGDTLIVKEGKTKTDDNGDIISVGKWLYDGQKFENLDDVLVYHKAAVEKKVTKGTRTS